MDKKSSEPNVWIFTIDTISKQFGTISASSTIQDTNESSKRRRNDDLTFNDHRSTWKSKEKSLSEKPIGLDGLRKAEERRSREMSMNMAFGRHGMERRSCRNRFRSPSDMISSGEKSNLHQTSLVKNNQLKIRTHMKITRLPVSTSAVSLNANFSTDPSTPFSTPSISPTLEERKHSEEEKEAKLFSQEERNKGKRQHLKRRVRSD